jgi:hypothetical protein
MGYGLDNSRQKLGFFYFRHHVQTSSGAHPASYPMGIGDSFSGIKAAGAWRGTSTTQYAFTARWSVIAQGQLYLLPFAINLQNSTRLKCLIRNNDVLQSILKAGDVLRSYLALCDWDGESAGLEINIDETLHLKFRAGTKRNSVTLQQKLWLAESTHV